MFQRKYFKMKEYTCSTWIRATVSMCQTRTYSCLNVISKKFVIWTSALTGDISNAHQPCVANDFFIVKNKY